MKCPECKAPLTDQQVRSLNGELNSGKRKAKRGGRPKLSPDNVQTIGASGDTGAALAARFGISVGHALRVRRAGRKKLAAARKAALDRMARRDVVDGIYDIVIGPGRVT